MTQIKNLTIPSVDKNIEVTATLIYDYEIQYSTDTL